MGHSPRILVSEHDDRLRDQLSRKLDASGFWVDAVGSAREALALLEHHHYDAMTLSLVLSDQDALSFLHDLKVMGIELPIIVTSIRNDKLQLPQKLMSNLDVDLTLDDSDEPEPEWVRKAADQARIIFAMKTACQRSRHYKPRVLHLEPDAFNSGLINAALRKNCDLIQVNNLDKLPDALYLGPYDLVLFNPLFPEDQGEHALHQIAYACPNTPIVLHTEYAIYAAQEDFVPVNCEPDQSGLGLVQALQNLVLHGMEAPICAHA